MTDIQDCIIHERIYLPPADEGANTEEYLQRYISNEFPDPNQCPSGPSTSVYSVPKVFQKTGERQATLAEQEVFSRLRGLSFCDQGSRSIQGLWMTFFHSACYAGHSYRNHRVGKLMIREHDFVIFAKYKGKKFMALVEVKSTNDFCTNKENLEVSSDAKVIKNNKRSAKHQLRDHMEILNRILNVDPEYDCIQSYIMWPFLGAYTRDPKQQVMKRWKEDDNLHVFEDTFESQETFNEWVLKNILNGKEIKDEYFITLLNRYIILSSGVFIDEINKGMLALLTQEQLHLINSDMCRETSGGPLVVHGAAGTGKTLLVLKKLEQLYQAGQLNDDNRALYICYWPGIRCEMRMKFETLGIDKYVDTCRFFISLADFLKDNKKPYKHIFMDEAEALCLALDGRIVHSTLNKIYQHYHSGNCKIKNCPENELQINEDMSIKIRNHEKYNWGEIWFMADINQASLFLPKNSPQMLKRSEIILSRVMRSTGNIFNVFKQFYSQPIPNLPLNLRNSMNIPKITMGHSILGPPVYWVNVKNNIDKAIAEVVIDLCATKGFKANDLCVIPFLINEQLTYDKFNKCIDAHFVENGFRPRAVDDVEDFLRNKELSDFLVCWALRVKGLEFKVVIMPIDGDDFDENDAEDRKKAYTIASRCTCMLILVCTGTSRKKFDPSNMTKSYPFTLKFEG